MKKIISALSLLILLLTLAACQNPLGEREYMEDLYVNIPNTDYQLLIKEWRYLLGSGEEVYFISAEGEEPVLLGNLNGGDDGYCPFKNGKYAVKYADGAVTISWSRIGNDTYEQSESFALPVDAP